MAKRWISLVGVTPLLLGIMFSVPQMVVAPLVLAQSSQSRQPTEAQRLYREGERLRQRGNRESLQQALAKFQQALPLFRVTGDRNGEADNLDSIGRVYDSLGQPQEALNYYQQALPIWREVGNREGERITLDNIGGVYSDIGQPQQALSFYEQALPIDREVGDRPGEATTLYRIGSVYSRIGQSQQALNFYEQALPIYRQLRDRKGEATTLYIIGSVYSRMGQSQQALNFYQQALPIWREVGNSPEERLRQRFGEAATLNNIGSVYISIGQPQQALTYLQQALPILREVGNRLAESTTLNSIGSVYISIGQPQQALDYFQQALPINRELRNRTGEATTLNNIGLVYINIGQPQQALNFYQQALPIYREVVDSPEERLRQRNGEATTLTNIGSMYNVIGQPQQALTYFQQSLLILREVRNRNGEATTLNNIGAVYNGIGQPQQALTYYQQALPILREVRDRNGEATTLTNIGSVYNGIGQPQQALTYYQQALPILREVGDRAGEATTLNNIGTAYRTTGQPQQSLTYYQQALPILREVDNRNGEARILNNIGTAYRTTGQPQQALTYYQQALPILREVDDRSGEAITLNNIGIVYRDTNQPTLAIANLEQSSEITLTTRSGLQRENRNQFLVSNRGNTTALVDLLIDQNQAARAYEWSNVYSTADLVDFNRLIDAKVGNPAAQTALDQWNQQNQQLAVLRSQLAQAFTPQLSQRINELETQNRTQGEEISRRFPEIAELLELKREDLTQLQAAIPAGTVVIQPVLLTNTTNIPNNLALFVLTRTTLTVKKVPIDPQEFDQLIDTYRNQLENKNDPNYKVTSAKLYDLLIKPIAAEIQTYSPQALAIIPTGKLRYLPFETLYDRESRQFLIQKYPISYLTRLSSRSLQQTPITGQGFFGIGNPTPSQVPLPGATQEIQAIQNIFPNNQILTEQAATLEAFKQDAPRFPILHLATHGCFQPNGCPDVGLAANTILFANNQQFPIADAALLGLNTRLLVLSACQTAQPAQGNGEEISGLAYVLERAGARAVMATLWSVEDKATRDLMISFYQNLNQGQDKAKALQQAKIAQINRHPYFWSAFLLIGDPR